MRFRFKELSEREAVAYAYRLRFEQCNTTADWCALERDFGGLTDPLAKAMKKMPKSVSLSEWVNSTTEQGQKHG